MKTCIACDQATVDPEEPPRYDVLSPSFKPGDPMSSVGPYCPECWPSTTTGNTTHE